MRRTSSALSRLVACALVFASPAAVRADDADPPQLPDVAAAESLFAAGRELMDKHAYAEACPKFEESNRLDPSAGTLLNLGKCMEALGKTATAWAAYKRAITVGKAKGQQRHVDAANEYITEVEPKLVKLVVETDAPVAGLTVTRTDSDGQRVDVGDAALGVEVAVDPSIYRVQAVAPGFDAWAGVADLREQGATVRVVVPPLKVTAEKRRVDPPPPTKKLDPLLVIGGVTAGVGVVGVAIGTAFGIVTLEDANTAILDPKLCPKYRCTPAGQALISTAETESVVSTVGLVVGGAALVGGGVMITYSLLTSKPHAPVAIAPLIGPNVAGFVVGGSL